MAEQALNEQTESPEQVADKRDRSTIQFAYLPLDDAVTVARGVHAVGTSCQLDQLAAELNVKTETGSFRLKVSNAKLFGVITHSQGTITLTNLGSRMCDPQQEQGARADAFLNVPLYKQVYEQFKGSTLPPNAGLENAMVTMGVAPKQKSVARQVFARSAQQAGFFAYGTNRLVPPGTRAAAAGSPVIAEGGASSGQETQNEKQRSGGGGDGGGIDCDPAILGLIKRLPPADSDWPLEKQARWLLAVSHAFAVVYPREDDGKSLKIEIVKD